MPEKQFTCSDVAIIAVLALLVGIAIGTTTHLLQRPSSKVEGPASLQPRPDPPEEPFHVEAKDR